MIPTVAAMAVLMGCVVSLFSTLKWVASPLPAYEQTWPVKGLEKYLGPWALKRRDDGLLRNGMSRILRIPLSGGVPREVARERITMLLGVLTSPNERYVVLSPLDKRKSIRIVEPASGRSRSVLLDGSEYSYPTVVAFSEDSRFVYVSVNERTPDRPDQLCRIDMEGGKAEVLATHMREKVPTVPAGYPAALSCASTRAA